MRNLFASVAFATRLLCLVEAKSVQERVWNFPDGSKQDLSSSFQQGDTVPLSWNACTGTKSINGYESKTDLWAVSNDLADLAYLIKTNINITHAATKDWQITISDFDLSQAAEWMLKFKPHSSSKPPKYDPTTPELSSPAFLVRSNEISTASSITSTSTSTSSSETSQTESSTGPPTPSRHPTKNTSSGGLGAGPKAAIGVLVGVAALAAAGVGLFFFMQRRKKKLPTYERKNSGDCGSLECCDSVKSQELYLNYTEPSELPAITSPVELPATRDL